MNKNPNPIDMATQPYMEMKFISKHRRTNRSFVSRVLLLIIVLFSVHSYVMAQPTNNTCATAQTITVGGDCTPATGTTGDLYLADVGTNITGGCANGRRDIWYRFTTPVNSTFVTITVALTSLTTTLASGNTNIELFNARNCTVNSTSLGCQDIASPRTFRNLTANTVYYFRIGTSQNPNTNPANWGIRVCVTSHDQPVNATTLTPGVTFTSHLLGASASPSIPVDCATGTPDDDVWFKFTAVNTFATVTLGYSYGSPNYGANLRPSNGIVQLFSGTPASLTSIGCGAGYLYKASGLTVGQTYYIRVYGAATGQTSWTQDGASFYISVTPSAPVISGAGRMKELYRQTIISAPQILLDPWEVTYGPDNKLWITESKGYKIFRMDPVTGSRDTILDVSQGSTFLPVGDQGFNVTYNAYTSSPQGGMAGMAVHPKFLDPVTPKNYVYVSYVYASHGGSDPNGIFYTTRLVRFTYNTGTQKLGSPVSLCDTLPGSNDHNSQRMIIVPVDGVDYLFYACGDMGAGQFSNRLRTMKAQWKNSYEGKILRFNLEADNDGGLNDWIPNDNPFNATLGVQSAVWSIGIRNNQGFAYDPVLNKLYGSSHGPYSDDELNVIERGKNYGHPLVIGYSNDNNYVGSTAGAALTASGGVSSCPEITDEPSAAAAIPDYKDPLFSAYAQTQPIINNIWQTNPNNGGWPSEGWSGLDLYQHTLVPGWSKSLVASSLKWGRLVRMRLYRTGDSVVRIGATDTASYFGGRNRFRDLAIVPGGKDIYVVIDKSSTTSGPTAANPIVSACGGCVQKYSFVGYADDAGKSTLPTDIDISAGATPNTVSPGTTVTIDADNSNYWVPITGPDGDIVAEIYANGQTLGQVTTSFFRNTAQIRMRGYARYLDRNITINAQFPPASAIKIRFYITKEEYDRLDNDPFSNINGLSDLKIHRNNDPCLPNMASMTSMINPNFTDAFDTKGYVLQANNITALSSFYFGAGQVTLPLNLLTFTGQYRNGAAHLKWETSSEVNTDHFIIERSLPNGNYEEIGKVTAKGSENHKANYTYIDENIASLGAPFVLYRLRIVDKNGEYTYSHTVTVQIPEMLITMVSIFPNPANNATVVSITSPREQQVTWQLIDNSGRTVLTNREQIRRGNNRITLDLSKIPAGGYFLQVNGQYVNNIQKLQKL